MKQKTTSTVESSTYTLKILSLAALLAIVAYFLTIEKTSKYNLMEPSPETAITSPSDLDQSEDELETINVDSIDVGLNQINSAGATF